MRMRREMSLCVMAALAQAAWYLVTRRQNDWYDGIYIADNAWYLIINIIVA